MFVERGDPVAGEAQASGGGAVAGPPGEPPPAGLPLGDVPLERIEHEICALAARIAAGTCRWLELVAEFDRRDGWGDWHGVRSCAEWLAWRCAIAPRAAREHVRVARRLAEVPRIHAAFATGELSYSKVRALTRIATAESEADLLELARHATAAQLERMIRAARRVTADEAVQAHERAFCSWSWEPDGSLRLAALLPAEEGAALLAALDACRDQLNEDRADAPEVPEVPETASRGSAEPPFGPSEAPRRGPTNDECLARLAQGALSSAHSHQVVVHVDAPLLASPSDGDGASHLDDGPAISAATARRIACESSLIGVVHGPEGEPLTIGRRTRAVPAQLRRALRLRDRGCRFPGCGRRRFTDAHHIVHWADGGATSLENLILLCRRHHRLCHEEGYSIERDLGGRLSFRDPRGRPIAIAPPLGPGRVDALPRSGPEAILTGTGERMDLAACVDAVLAAVGFAD